jgi:hypothetical protein
MMTTSNHTLTSTVGGTFLSVLPNLHSDDLIKTSVLAVLGAVVSFIVSLALKSLFKKDKK